jgi:GcrA cell cycle regulator
MRRFLWNETKLATLREMYLASAPIAEIAKVLGANSGDIKGAAERLRKQMRRDGELELLLQRSRPHDFWTPERLRLLVKLVGEKQSSNKIADQIGATRSAVVGKCQRLGLRLLGGVPPKRKPKAVPEAVVVPVAVKVVERLEQDGEPPLIVDYEYDAQNEFPVEHRKNLMELTNESCRFPVGDPRGQAFFFCGCEEADMAQGRPYCPKCAARAFVASRAISVRATTSGARRTSLRSHPDHAHDQQEDRAGLCRRGAPEQPGVG